MAGGLALVATGAGASVITRATPNTTLPAAGLGTTYAGVTTLTFEGLAAGTQPAGFSPAAGSTPGGGVVTGGNSQLYAAPYGDTSNFYAVAYNPAAGPVFPATDTFTPGGSYNYFGVFAGSIDTYNTISFLNGASLVASFTGADFPPATGAQASPNTSEYLDFLFTGTDRYTSVTFTTARLNLEVDNLAYGNVAVPEPASLALLGAGLCAAGFAGRQGRRGDRRKWPAA